MDGFDGVRRFGMLRRKRDFVSSVEVRGATLQAVLLMSCDVAACLLVMLLSTPMDPLESLQRLVLLCTLKYIEVSKIGVQDGSRMFQTSPYHTRSLPFDFRWVDL